MPRTVAQIKELVNHLKAQGVRSYKDKECELEFAPPASSSAPAVPGRPRRERDPEFPDQDPDLFAHEGQGH